MKRLWIVRAGKHGERELAALEQGRLMPGFQQVANLGACEHRDAILELLHAVYPDDKKKALINFAGQLNQFANAMAIGDFVVMPRKHSDGVAIGRVQGGYEYHPDTDYKHGRKVEWLQESIPRDVFNQDLRFSFGAFMTICQVKRNNAVERVAKVIEAGVDPGPLLGQQGKHAGGLSVNVGDEEAQDADEFDADIEDIANQQIISLIKSEFAGHALADLVAEILRIEGYTTKVSPPGPDGGVDILAAGGVLGLGEDRVCVQVKSGDGAANHDVVLRLIGSVSNTQAHTGLLVSLGGLNTVAQKEMDNNFFRLRLWQMPELLRALFRTYNELSDETRAKIPLKQIWAPIADEGI